MVESVTELCLKGRKDSDDCVEWEQEALVSGDAFRCLSTHIPAWSIPHPRIMACFQCCIMIALNTSELSKNYEQMTRWALVHGISPWHGGHFDANYMKKRNTSFGVTECVDKYGAASAMLSDLAFVRLAHTTNFYYSSDWMVASRSADTTLAVVQGWTNMNRKALKDIHTLDATDAPPHVRQRTTLLLMGDQDLPEPSWTDAVIMHSPVKRIGVHNPHPDAAAALGPRLFVFPRGVRSMCDWDAILSDPNGYSAQTNRVRPHLLHCSCIGLSRHAARRSKLKVLQRNGFKCQAECPYGVAAREYLHSTFVFSPRGNSRQNFRDWEALQAGAIPLVDRDDALAELYADLPIVAISNWSLVTPAYLDTVWNAMQTQTYDLRRMYLPFWLRRVL